MPNNTQQWRFFTEMCVGDGVVTQRWRWAHVDATGAMTKSVDGLYTIAAAVDDARQHGFTGSVESADADLMRGTHDAERWLFSSCAI